MTVLVKQKKRYFNVDVNLSSRLFNCIVTLSLSKSKLSEQIIYTLSMLTAES